MENVVEKIKDTYKNLPSKKPYLEVVTSLLSIPILLTVLITNAKNLQNTTTAKAGEITPIVSPVTERVVTIIRESPPKKNTTGTIYPTAIPTQQNNATPTDPPASTPIPTNAVCKKEVGPVNIVSPEEGETVSEDPVSLNISYTVGEYCAAAWSYRINEGAWSSYTDKSISLYNLPAGEKRLELRVKSIASDNEKLLRRKFVVARDVPQTASPSAIPVASE